MAKLKCEMSFEALSRRFGRFGAVVVREKYVTQAMAMLQFKRHWRLPSTLWPRLNSTVQGSRYVGSRAVGRLWIGAEATRRGIVKQSWGRSLIFDLKIKDPSDFADLFDDLDHTRGSDLIDGDLDLKINL